VSLERSREPHRCQELLHASRFGRATGLAVHAEPAVRSSGLIEWEWFAKRLAEAIESPGQKRARLLAPSRSALLIERFVEFKTRMRSYFHFPAGNREVVALVRLLPLTEPVGKA
jgi:hypothetical protein